MAVSDPEFVASFFLMKTKDRLATARI